MELPFLGVSLFNIGSFTLSYHLLASPFASISPALMVTVISSLLMAVIIGVRLRPGEPGLLDLAKVVRQQIYRHLLIDENKHGAIPIFRITLDTCAAIRFAVTPRSLSAQLLKTCHQILNEAYFILYTENNFALYLNNNLARPKAIPVLLTSGNFCTLGRITISIQSARLLGDDLQDLLVSLPLLRTLSIDGNLLRTIDFYRALECAPDNAIQRCIDQSLGLLLSTFGGKESFRNFVSRHSRLALEYTFGVAVDLILPATVEVVKGVPQVGSK